MEHIPDHVYVELGNAGLDIAAVRAIIADASHAASLVHQMGAEGRVNIPKTKRVLVYNGGIDGMDWRVYIEDEAPKTADELVRMAMNLIESHRNSTSYGYGSGPALYEWEGDARLYLKSQEAK